MNNLSHNIKEGSKKGSCDGNSFDALTKNGGQWKFAWAIFKDENAKNCGTTASASEIACIFYVTV